MLKQRILTALILLILVGIIIFYVPPTAFAAACWLICLIAIYEMTQIYHFSLAQSIMLLLINTALVAGINKINQDISQIVRIVTVITWCFAIPLVLIFLPKKFPKWVIGVLSTVLFIPGYYSLIVLHALFGPWQLISIMAIAWISDTGAYFTGKIIGRHKLAPQISPGKSIEGALGGLILVIGYLLIIKFYSFALYLPNYNTVLKFALILTVVGIIGDLFESWLKRVAGVKDSGNILPGHGGVFDRIDSLIAVLAIAFALIRGMI